MNRSLIRTIAVPTLFSLATVVSAGAQAHPNFSGTWVLDSAKSVIASPMTDQIPQLAHATWTIVQHGDTVTSDREMQTAGQPAIKSHLVMGTDGKPWKNSVPVNGEPVETSTVVSWEGNVLVAQTSFNFQGTDIVQTDRWSASPDGKTLVSKRVVMAGDQEVNSSTLTFNKKS